MRRHTKDSLNSKFAGLGFSPEAYALVKGDVGPMISKLERKDDLYSEDYGVLIKALKGEIRRPRGRPRLRDRWHEIAAATEVNSLINAGSKFEAAVTQVSTWYGLPIGSVRRVYSQRYGAKSLGSK